MDKEQVNASRFNIKVVFDSYFNKDGTISADRTIKITEINNEKTKDYSINQSNAGVWISSFQEDLQQGFFD